MFTTPDQMVAMHKAALESFQAMAAKSFAGLEKLAELNMAATKSSFEESAEQFKALLEVKDAKGFADFAAGNLILLGSLLVRHGRVRLQIGRDF